MSFLPALSPLTRSRLPWYGSVHGPVFNTFISSGSPKGDFPKSSLNPLLRICTLHKGVERAFDYPYPVCVDAMVQEVTLLTTAFSSLVLTVKDF